MNSGSIEYLNLKELANEEYSLVDGEADITGWPVGDESGTSIGKVRDLLFDPHQHAVRYLIVDLDKAVSGVDDKAVLLPIGFVNLGEDKKEVIIPVLHNSQIELMPQYIIGEVTRDTEVQIRSAIGSPAALRIEEEIAEFDHSNFYQHHHFDRGNILSRKQEILSDVRISEPESSNRVDERNTIHGLIENADQSAANLEFEQSLSDSDNHFSVDVAGRTFIIEPHQNGTYRILNGEEKLGVIYAEPGQVGTIWKTMDKLDDSFVISVGNAILSHKQS